MENLRYLLAAMAALTLIMSVVSTVNPSYFAGVNAFAEEHDEDDENSGSNDEHEDEEEHEDDNSGEESDNEEDDDEHEDDDHDNKVKNDEKDDEDEGEMVQSLGNNSKAELEVDDHAELKVEIEDGDLGDGTYDVVFACDTPDVNEAFADALEVDDGDGEFEEDLPLTNGTYSGCEVEVGGLSATFASFTIAASEDDEDQHDDEKDDEHEEEADDEHDDEKNDEHEEEDSEHDFKKESRLKADEDGVEIEVEMEGLNMTDGSYDAVFACETPAFNVTLDDAFEVDDGEGKLEETIGLANGTYNGCEITVEGTELASFRTFTVSEESEDEQEQRVEEKRKEKRERIVTVVNGTAIHERHRHQNAASPGEYEPGWNYTLTANGTATHDVHNGTADHEAEAQVDIDMAVWKSNRAMILLDVLGGTVDVENQTYTVVLGYALYTTQHDTFRLGALAVDDDGNVYKLKLRGIAIDDESEFPAESGSIDLEFEGSRGSPDRLGDWELAIDGTITAG